MKIGLLLLLLHPTALCIFYVCDIVTVLTIFHWLPLSLRRLRFHIPRLHTPGNKGMEWTYV